uniref:Fc alpha receptor n=1 Tax=Nomascus leucogenys TaxID=61853 RepID=A0A2I3GHJ9_NOMLE
MDPKETTLLCLVLCLGQRIQAQEGDSPMPFISAKSSPVIPLGGSVKIECQAIREAYLTQLMILKNSTYQEIGRRLKFWNETNPDFIVNHMDANKAGRYQCQYRIGHYRFRYSDTLELVVTEQPGQHSETSSLLKMEKIGRIWWHIHKALNKEASADVAETSWNQQMCQPGLTFARTPSVCK